MATNFPTSLDSLTNPATTDQLNSPSHAAQHENANDAIEQLQANPAAIASRKASQNAINAFAPMLPELLGGSADLTGSNVTLWNGYKGISADDASGNYI